MVFGSWSWEKTVMAIFIFLSFIEGIHLVFNLDRKI